MRTEKIMIVEDEATVARDIRDCLESIGYEVTTMVGSAQEAIERAREISGQARISYLAFDDDGHKRRVIADPARWGDAVIVRKDVPASYHLAVVVDDHRQGITHVTRGKDLEAATDLHRLLQVLFGFEAPRYHHHRLLLDERGAKLAKRSGSESLRSLREKGLTPENIRRMVTTG